LSINCYSQISFEKGYYINNSNQKVDCLIKNLDWKNNPIEFEFKLTENSDKKKASIDTVKKFEIYNVSKFIRRTIKIDKSSNIVSKLSDIKQAIFNEEELFLKVLVEGKANLYSYENDNLERYFYSKDSSEIEQLIFKRYLNIDKKIGTNNRYKQQLWNNLKCPKMNMSKVENLVYYKNELIRFFVEYNECNKQGFTNFEEKQKRDLFNLNIRPGFNTSSLSIQNGLLSSSDADFGNKFGFRLGVEAEFIMSFNKNKWAILIEPTYQYFKSETELTTQNVTVDYKSIELPIGLRHYFFLNENSKIFINGSVVIDFNDNSLIDFETDYDTDLEIASSWNLAFGLGYKHNDRYSLELRYQTNRDVLSDYSYWSSDYKTLSIIFGYSLF
jgi:hypothetical protein